MASTPAPPWSSRFHFASVAKSAAARPSEKSQLPLPSRRSASPVGHSTPATTSSARVPARSRASGAATARNTSPSPVVESVWLKWISLPRRYRYSSRSDGRRLRLPSGNPMASWYSSMNESVPPPWCETTGIPAMNRQPFFQTCRAANRSTQVSPSRTNSVGPAVRSIEVLATSSPTRSPTPGAAAGSASTPTGTP